MSARDLIKKWEMALVQAMQQSRKPELTETELREVEAKENAGLAVHSRLRAGRTMPRDGC